MRSCNYYVIDLDDEYFFQSYYKYGDNVCYTFHIQNAKKFKIKENVIKVKNSIIHLFPKAKIYEINIKRIKDETN